MAKAYRNSRRDPVSDWRAVENMGRPARAHGYQDRHLSPDDDKGTVLREDMSQVLGLPRGAVQKDIDSESHQSYYQRGVNDAFELINQTLKEDMVGIRRRRGYE